MLKDLINAWSKVETTKTNNALLRAKYQQQAIRNQVKRDDNINTQNQKKQDNNQIKYYVLGGLAIIAVIAIIGNRR